MQIATALAISYIAFYAYAYLHSGFSKNPTSIFGEVKFPHFLDQKNNPKADDIILNFEK